MAADSSPGEPLKPRPNADSPRRVRFWNGTRDLSAPAAPPIRLTSSVGGRNRACASAIKRTPRSPTNIAANTVEFDPGTLERNEQRHPIIAGRVGPGTVRIIRMRPLGEGSQMNRRGLLQRAAVTIPFLSGMWSWLLGPIRGWGAARSHSRVRPGDPGWPSEASWSRLSRDVGDGSSRCSRRSPPARTRRRARPAPRFSRT